jgi:hypothetical protein
VGLVLVTSVRKDDDNTWHKVVVQLRLRNGETRDVTSEESLGDFDGAMDDVSAVVRFLEQKLGLKTEVICAT